MVLTRSRFLIRRLALALAATQLLAYAAAPTLEALTERSPGPTHIEAEQPRSCVPVHSPSKCLTCQLLTASARRPEPVRVPVQAEITAGIPCTTPLVATSRAPPSGFLTRAPPTSLV